MRKELLIGCGAQRKKVLFSKGNESWSNLVTLDIEAVHKPDVIHDLCVLPYPFESDEFDEIHAYDVLEHTGQQGDYKFFFAQFSEFWRILKPNGMLFAKCPSYKSSWAWGDPGHTRIIQSNTLVFLKQPEYTKQIGKSQMTDYRSIYKADFQEVYVKETDEDLFFVMKAIKPSRISI
jgi:predicted SAM-dependent methyltransferase